MNAIHVSLLFRYTLAQEHGDLINLHDWFQSFKTIVLRPSKKGKPKLKQSPLPKKRKDMNESENKSEASIQYPIAFSFAFVFISYTLQSLVEGIYVLKFLMQHMKTQKLLWKCVCVCVCVCTSVIHNCVSLLIIFTKIFDFMFLMCCHCTSIRDFLCSI